MWGDAWEMVVKSDAFHVILNYESCFKSTGKYAAFKKQFARDISNVSSVTNVRRHKRAYESSLIRVCARRFLLMMQHTRTSWTSAAALSLNSGS